MYFVICVSVFLIFIPEGTCSTTTQAPLTCETVSCAANQYCQQNQGGPICRLCDDACSGCIGYGPTRCKECKPGYRNNTNTRTCEPCPTNTYGVDCVGTCHCLLNDCNQQTGFCESNTCFQGWSGPPSCQTPCTNTTFGSNCVYQCHCPPDDTCSPVNGLCSSNGCAVGWASAGCQNELPQLNDPPTAENVTCSNMTVTWRGWRTGVDKGSTDRKIAQYELYMAYNASREFAPKWQHVRDVRHVFGVQQYTENVVGLEPDVFYVYRVDVRQYDGDKLIGHILDGKISEEFFTPCTQTTTTTTTTVTLPITTRPPGPYLLDESKFFIQSFEGYPNILQIEWAVLEDVANFTLSVTLNIFEVKVREPDCPENDIADIDVITLEKSGSYNVTNLLPWRLYRFNLTAVSETHNLTDSLHKDAGTPEDVPTAPVRNLKVSSIAAGSALVSWYVPECSGRNGAFQNYTLDVYALPNDTHIAMTYDTDSPFFEITSLMPYKNYSVSVVYVNSAGRGPQVATLVSFRTLEAVPGPPSISSIRADMTSITLVVQEPAIPNGIVLEYHVSVAENVNFQSSVTKSFLRESNDRFLTAIMTNLLPDTTYFIKVSASTSVGPGQPSPTRQIETKQSVPRPPANITSDKSSRNVSCVKLQWSHEDISNGNITGYNVSYQETGVTQGTVKSFVTENTYAQICDLKSGRYYTFMIKASNPTGFSEASILTISTEQPDPPIPPLPEVINTTSTTIGVALFPVVVTNTLYEYGYLVSIQDVTGKTKRAVSTSNISCPGINEIPGTIVKNFTQAEIPFKISFIIGDGKQYGDFENKPLTKNNLYDIYYVITSYFEDVCKYTFVKTSSPVKVAPAAVMVPNTTESSSTNVVLIVGIVILVVIIIIFIIVFVYCWWRRRQSDQNYKPYYNESDDHFDLKIYERIDNYNAQKYWNTIYSLRESRYIVEGREHIRDGQRIMNGSVGVATGEQPLLFQDEFSNLPHGRLSAFNVAKKRDNELKNRFSHLLPYDHSRVILDPDVNSESDYINASFIKGYKHQRAYIAAQSPFDEDTVLDFWRMIYQYEVRVIVMLSNIVEDNIVKCTQYWPDQGRAMYGQFILDLVDVQEYADYTLRSLRVRTSTERDWQMVYIFDYTSWPEHGVPGDAIPLLEMRRKINVYQNRYTTPIVVHCGTGVSRSGVYIAVDSLLQQYEQEGRISVYSFVKKMRKDRPAMVRTAKQYIFIYEAIFEAMVVGDTLTGPGDLKEMYESLTKKNPNTKHSYLHGQFHCLEEYTRKLYPSACSHAYFPANVNKNRFCEIVPPDQFRPILTTPGGLGRTDYINAVYLDSHRKSCHYVITQTPLHTTVIDFWKLVYDHDIYTIVMMEPMTFDDDTSAEYWPEDHMKQYEPFFVETADVYQQENITIRNFKLTSMGNPKDTRHIRQFQFNAWADSEFVPKSKSMLLDVIDLVDDWQRVNNNDSTPILVHCKDGATHSGLFIAVSLLCEKVLDEGEVDVFHTIKHLKRRRTQIVDMLDQYRFCYKALWDFINMRMPGGTLTEQMSKTIADKPYSSLSLASYASAHDYMPY